MDDFKASDKITVLGTTGTGKSTLMRKLSALWPRVIIIDPVHDWTDGESFSDFNKFSERLIQLKNENSKKFRIIFRFDTDMPRYEKEKTLNEVLRLAFHFKNLQVVIDEVQLFSSPHFISDHLQNLLFIGRHHNVSLIAGTQRPGQLNKAILSQSQHVFCGQLHEKNDLRVVSDFLNIDQDRIINQKKGTFFHFSPGKPVTETLVFKPK